MNGHAVIRTRSAEGSLSGLRRLRQCPVGPAHEGRRKVVEEAGRDGVTVRAEQVSPSGERQEDPFPRPGESHVEEAPLLLDLVRGIDRPRVGQQPVFQSDEEHDVELQPLGVVQRHQADRLGLLAGRLLGRQRHLLEKLQHPFLPHSRERLRHPEQFADVLQVLLPAGAFAPLSRFPRRRLQGVEVPRPLQKGVQRLRGGQLRKLRKPKGAEREEGDQIPDP